MPRIARIVIANRPHLVRLRPSPGRRLFAHHTDRGRFLDILRDRLEDQHVQFLGSRLEPSQVYLILQPADASGLARALRNANGYYSRCVNGREGAKGHLFRSRFESCALSDQSLAPARRLMTGSSGPEFAPLLLCLSTGRQAE